MQIFVKTRGDFKQRKTRPAHPVGRSPAILPVVQSTMLHPGATVASAGPEVPRILCARAVTKLLCCSKRGWTGRMHRIWPCIQSRTSSGPMLGVGSKVGPQQEPDALNGGVDRFPGERPRTAHPSRGEPGKGTWQLFVSQQGSREEALPGEAQCYLDAWRAERRWRGAAATRGGSSQSPPPPRPGI